MNKKFAWSASAAVAILFAVPMLFASSTAMAQAPGRQITGAIDDSNRVTLFGNTRPEARVKANDRGMVSDGTKMFHMQLLLSRPAAQEARLQTLIEQLHNAKSPNFHHWLTADELGREFGVAGADIQSITGWLKSKGFTVNFVYANQLQIDFSGMAGQVRNAFKTEIHSLRVGGSSYISNVTDPQIPAALSSAVKGIVTLNNFKPIAMNVPRTRQYTLTLGNSVYQAVVPADLEKIYNFTTLFNQGISGQGQTVVVVEDSDVYSTGDWSKFRAAFGLAGYTAGSFTTVHPNSRGGLNCQDPGVNGDDVESIIDAEYASAAAPSAHIEMATCNGVANGPGTFPTAYGPFNFGGFIALQNLLDTPTHPDIVSVSYGLCETYDGAAFNAYINSLYQQAVAEGVSVYVSAGDADAAVCDRPYEASFQGISITGWGETQYNVSVGGTDFGDSFAGTNSTYWGSTNTSTYGSALSYIPEIPWNDSCASTLLAQVVNGSPVTYGSTGFCNTTKGQGLWLVAGGSGGPSGCAYGATSSSAAAVSGTCAGYAKPSYQSGIKGNPSDGVRDIPDISMFAANGIWGHFYVICYSDPRGGGVPCTGSPSNWPGYGGTSFGSPIMAGVQALINQKTKTNWGNPNYVYYPLANVQFNGAQASQCNSTLGNGVSASCVFYDVTEGDMDVNCTSAANLGASYLGSSFYNSLTYTGPVNCYIPSGFMGVLSTSNSSYQPAYKTGSGWDFATGIGTINVANLVNAWHAFP